MADHHDDAGPVVEEVLERAQRVEVEVVGRLVEQQHVGLLDQGEQQLQPPPLAAAERADRRELGVAVEPEPLHQRSRRRATARPCRRPPPRAPAG